MILKTTYMTSIIRGKKIFWKILSDFIDGTNDHKKNMGKL